MAKKKIDSNIKPTHTVLFEDSNTKLLELIEIYKVDKKKARIKFYNSGLPQTERVILFEYPNGDFSISKFIRKYGFSKTGIIYNSQKLIWSLIYKNKKLYWKEHNQIRNLTYDQILMFQGSNLANWYGNEIFDYMFKRFTWLRNISDDPLIFKKITLNYLINHKLFTKNDLLRYKYDLPLPIAKIIEHHFNFKDWTGIKHHFINIEAVKPEFFKNMYIHDMIGMCRSTGYKINCKWGEKRMKLEHDKWSKEIRDVLFELTPTILLKINSLFVEFQEFSGYTMLKTNRELLEEGKRMSHCVGGYSDKVSSGSCAIYVVDGYTLQLKKNYKFSYGTGETSLDKIEIGQFYGYDNTPVPLEVVEKVNSMVFNFNEEKAKQAILNKIKNNDSTVVNLDNNDIERIKFVEPDEVEENDEHIDNFQPRLIDDF